MPYTCQYVYPSWKRYCICRYRWVYPGPGSPSNIFVCSKAPWSFILHWLRHRYAEYQYNIIQDMITIAYPCSEGIEHICNEEDCYEDTHLLQKGWISWILVNIDKLGCFWQKQLLDLDLVSWWSYFFFCFSTTLEVGDDKMLRPAGAMRRSLTLTKEAGFLVRRADTESYWFIL